MSVRSVMMFVARKATEVRRGIEMLEARIFNSRHAPALDVAYAAFVRESQISSRRQPRKGRDLWRLLEAARPSSIVELGSGTTTAVFALWSGMHGARYVAYEHNEGWAGVTRKCLREADLGGPESVRVVTTRVARDGQAVGFAEAVPMDADFVYVDGPPCVLESGRKVANDD